MAAQNDPKSGVPSIVYLHAGLEIGFAIPYAIHPGVQRRLPCTWLSKISMPLGVVTIRIGSTIAKMAKSVVSVDRLGWETLAILRRQDSIHNP